MTLITTASGRSRRVAAHVDTTEILGLDQDGRVVVQQDWMRGGSQGTYAFGLTLCCDAYDKGMEDGVYCRACHGEKSDDAGNYLYEDADGNYPGLDPVESIVVPH